MKSRIAVFVVVLVESVSRKQAMVARKDGDACGYKYYTTTRSESAMNQESIYCVNTTWGREERHTRVPH